MSSVILCEQNIASISSTGWFDDPGMIRIDAGEAGVAIARICGAEWIYHVNSTHEISQLLLRICRSSNHDSPEVVRPHFPFFICAVTMKLEFRASPAIFEVQKILVVSGVRHCLEQRVIGKHRREACYEASCSRSGIEDNEWNLLRILRI